VAWFLLRFGAFGAQNAPFSIEVAAHVEPQKNTLVQRGKEPWEDQTDPLEKA
jgi:hypothetical protein